MHRRSLAASLAVLVALFASLGFVSRSIDPAAFASAGQAWPAPRAAKNLTIIGHNDLGQLVGNTAEVWYGKGIAYVSYRCSHQTNPIAKGTSIVDVRNPTNPIVLTTTSPISGGFADDVWGLVDLDTEFYTGDLLVEPHDYCTRSSPQVTRFWNITDPGKPVLLSTLVTGDGVHNVYAFTRMESGKQKAYVILAAPYADTADNTIHGWEDKDLDADFAIVDATDPTRPEIVGKFNLHQAVPNLPAGTVFQHDTWANKAGTMAYGAYWDAGVAFLDISDVRNIKYVSRWDYPQHDEGNAHAVVLTKNEDYAIVTDEDFDPFATEFVVLEPASIAGLKVSRAGNFSGPSIEGEVVWTGRGCPVSAASMVTTSDTALNDPTGKIALIRRGTCTFAEKLQWAQDHGAAGAIIMNEVQNAGPSSMGGTPMTTTRITAVGITYEDGTAISATLAAGTPVRVRYGQSSNGAWGFTRILDIKNIMAPRQVAEYVITQTRQYPPAPGAGSNGYSVHNVYVQGDKAYISHYAGGVRVLDITNPERPIEAAYVIPATTTGPSGQPIVSRIWGIIADEGQNLFASDMSFGLWVMREAADVPSPTATAVPPTAVPPTAAPPTAIPADGRVCPQITNRVPTQVISMAVANPSRIDGYNQPERRSLPVGPSNPLRTWLTLQTLAKPYHPVANSVVYRASCP